MTGRDLLAKATAEDLGRWAAEAQRLAACAFAEADDRETEAVLDGLAALARAVAKMQRHGAFVDGGALPWTLAIGDDVDDVATNAPTLPAALAALLEAP